MRFFFIFITIFSSSIFSQELSIEEIIVSADFTESQSKDISRSIHLINDDKIDQSGIQHFEDLLLQVPNLNWSGETSRPRYFQIRGIGEREQYQGAPNSSVGFIFDGIDFSGIGMVATLFDLDQIEVLRGPQGARYGANALAGLINITSKDPTDQYEFKSRVQLGNNNTQSLGIAFGGPSTSNIKYRFVAQKYNNDGFRENIYLRRSNTNKRDELTSRLKINWQPNRNIDLNLTTILANLNNGYDAWVNNNTFETLSDKPGKDSQKSKATNLQIRWLGNDYYDFHSISSYSDSNIEVSYDGDWGNNSFWKQDYDYNSLTKRNRQSLSQEIRLTPKSSNSSSFFNKPSKTVTGIYLINIKEHNHNLEYASGLSYKDLNSNYDAKNLAFYFQNNLQINQRLNFSTNYRIEKRDASYKDTNNLAFNPKESMWGGGVSINYNFSENKNWYFSYLKGYKAGGFNIGSSVPNDRKAFTKEFLYSAETGFKGSFFNDNIRGSVSFFSSSRRDQQVSTSLQLDPNDPLSYIYFTDNAAKGFNRGIEVQLIWNIRNNINIDYNLGLLDTEYSKFQNPTLSVSGRDQAHSPKYQYSIGINYENYRGFFGSLDLQGRDEFYYDDSHNKKSNPYHLVNLKLGYQRDNWVYSLWSKNLFNQSYSVRGFYFANDPNDMSWTPQLFRRLGDPRHFGITIDYKF
ncbi:MAG: TonB-dependent receptor [Pseudomonadota bacterium]|nr:TonB-dependent receptor [Gammaproteobacteria bacterium]MEE2684010.1 TonB-dependent receptor [Pseudomonadota bacterium]|tara:strand:- start:1910 stop:3973 length:2064 start_codon:yes stop_codon:yes gene_type:complete